MLEEKSHPNFNVVVLHAALSKKKKVHPQITHYLRLCPKKKRLHAAYSRKYGILQVALTTKNFRIIRIIGSMT